MAGALAFNVENGQTVGAFLLQHGQKIADLLRSRSALRRCTLWCQVFTRLLENAVEIIFT